RAGIMAGVLPNDSRGTGPLADRGGRAADGLGARPAVRPGVRPRAAAASRVPVERAGSAGEPGPEPDAGGTARSAGPLSSHRLGPGPRGRRGALPEAGGRYLTCVYLITGRCQE